MDHFFHMDSGDLDPINNDWEPNSELKITRDSIAYYKSCINKFYKRPATQTFAKKRITKKKEGYLYKIFAIFKKHQTNYKIVIAPLYDQVKLNPEDLTILDQIFGTENVYDYSGINAITNNVYNYNSDVIHYRKKVGNLIYKEIYRKPASEPVPKVAQ